MFVVVLTKGPACVDLKVFATWEEARKEYRRQVRNAWRRKSAWNQCQFHTLGACDDSLERMTWRTGRGTFNCLELRMATPAWIKAVQDEIEGQGAGA